VFSFVFPSTSGVTTPISTAVSTVI
jgi:hypothetical protein